jgi:hypothetical protein
MSQPARPTRVNRKAVLLRAVPRRMSEASARIAPAPAQMPSIRRDDRLRAGAHRLHQVARHAGEGQQAGHVELGQRADDLVHVAAGAEVLAGAGDDDGLDVVGIGQRAEQVAQLGVGIEGQRVLALGRFSVSVATPSRRPRTGKWLAR